MITLDRCPNACSREVALNFMMRYSCAVKFAAAVMLPLLCVAQSAVKEPQQVSSKTSDPVLPAAPSVPAGGRICAKDDYHDPRVMTKVDPKYTVKARRNRVHGTVTLKLFVNEQGLPEHITLFEGLDEGLNKKAIEAARKWRFFPATCKNEPMAAAATIKIDFKLK